MNIFISATEQSGDNIGSNIMRLLLDNNQYIKFDGVGGSKMNPFFNNQYFDIKDFKTIGLIEIIFSLKKYLKMIFFLSNKIIINNYDLVITIDSPDFNYPLVKRVRKKNYNKSIIHIVAPTVWAWRPYRAHKFSKIFDEILVLFEFEKIYFTKYGLKSTFIGHPIYYIKANNDNKFKKKNIAFLPGSRLNEIQSLFYFFQIAYKNLLITNPNIVIFIPTLPHLKNIIENYVKDWKLKVIVSINNEDIEYNYSLTRYALVCSGTASLEIAKRQIPQLIIYKLNFLTEIIFRNFIKIRFASIINIIENKIIIPELTNSNLSKKKFINYFHNLITDDNANNIQILNVKKTLLKIQNKKSPYLIAVERINSYL